MLGFGGRETVCKELYRLLIEKNLSVEFLFINDIRQDVDDEWLDGIPFERISSKIWNTKLRRLHFGFILS